MEVIEELQETQAMLHSLEQAAAQHPDTPSLSLNIKSIQKRQHELEVDFATLTHAQYMDVCRYRVFGESDNQTPTLPTLTHVLGDFQSAFTLVYDALKSGKQKRQNQVGAEVAQQTAFGYGYSFSGSVGFVLTLPNERLLLDQTIIDKAIETVFKMLKPETVEQLSEYAHTLGPAPVRLVYKWATDHVKSGTGADIDWRRDQEVRASLFIQTPELEKLRQKIEQINDVAEEDIPLEGNIVGMDVDTHNFHMKFEEGNDIKGKMDESIGREYASVALPKRYKAMIRKTTTTSYSTDEEKVSYYLLSLQEL
ncbi:MAG: hypothetical protein JO316_03705 [Abitibacteriaceae bacterium]|nr:hypothetical protein [Abditibacteriaceae bacterium]